MFVVDSSYLLEERRREVLTTFGVSIMKRRTEVLTTFGVSIMKRKKKY
jgi:hypothetical protein